MDEAIVIKCNNNTWYQLVLTALSQICTFPKSKMVAAAILDSKNAKIYV